MPHDPGPPRVLGADEANDLLGNGLASDDVNPLTGVPLLAVAVDDEPAVRSLVRASRDAACVVVGVSRHEPASNSALDTSLALGFDVLLSAEPDTHAPWVGCPNLESTLEQLARAVRSSPLASLSLVQLLRAGEELAIADALVAESWVYSMLQAGPQFREWLTTHRHERAASHPEGSPIVVVRQGGHLAIELNRPQVHNALNMAMREALIDVLRAVVADSSIEVVHLLGSGSSFCSGGDLTEFGTAPDPVTAHAARISRSVGAWLARCADRVTVEAHGGCIGAGVELAAFAGHVRAAPDTLISLPEVAMGLIPGAGGTVSIPRRIGRHRTAYLALSGCSISVSEASDWGLVDEIG